MSSSSRPFVAALAAAIVLGYIGLEAPAGIGTTVAQPGLQADVPQHQAESGDLPSSDTKARAAGDPTGPAPKDAQAPADTLQCALGRNGGRTDKGVTATKIRVASTVVQDGPAASLLSGSPIAIKAVIDKTNKAGGICGRLIDLVMRNDSFESSRGQLYLQNFIEEDVFALAVVPSAEGLGAAILGGDIARAGIPVVGTDGMRVEQYSEPWVWPVATATVSTMRIIAQYAYEQKGARTFAIVWDSKYKFGREGADAFKAQVRKLGGEIVADQRLDPDKSAYATEAQAFNDRCKGGVCDAVVMLLLPDTAQKWMSRRPAKAKLYTAGAQTLFTEDFARNCASAAELLCNGIAVWTGFNPPIDRYATIPDVASYVDDLKAIAPSLDVKNQFAEGAYLGMTLFVEALKRVGPNLTRARLRAVLDGMTYRNGITAGLTWRPGKHYANQNARAFSMVVSDDGRFVGWRDEQSGWVRDPALG